MYINRCSAFNKVENKLGVTGFHIDTTVAHHMAEVTVPISAVDRVITGKPGNVRNIW